MKTRYALALYAVAASLLTGCGCNLVGYPAIDGIVLDRTTGRSLALGGATVRYENGVQSPVEHMLPEADTTSRIWVCCTPGNWRIRIDKPGYFPYDSTVRVRSSGQCDRPVLVRLVARLQPLARSASALSSEPGSRRLRDLP